MTETTDFGFRTVPAEAKRGMVREVFDSVAPSYDLMNDLMSLGLHRAWKRAFVAEAAVSPAETLLDLAGGTGDIAFACLDRGAGGALLSDVNHEMLVVAQGRAAKQGLGRGLHILCADAERLPLPDRSVPVVTMAFGLRNCTDKDRVLREARRVLRPGGRFLCLEFSKVEVSVLARVYDAWSFGVLPRLGALVARDSASYRYLAESIRTFPDQAELGARFGAAGFARVGWRSLSGGVVAIHRGFRV